MYSTSLQILVISYVLGWRYTAGRPLNVTVIRPTGSLMSSLCGRSAVYNFTVTQHVQGLVTSSAQTNYALPVLRCHVLNNAARSTLAK